MPVISRIQSLICRLRPYRY